MSIDWLTIFFEERWGKKKKKKKKKSFFFLHYPLPHPSRIFFFTILNNNRENWQASFNEEKVLDTNEIKIKPI